MWVVMMARVVNAPNESNARLGRTTRGNTPHQKHNTAPPPAHAPARRQRVGHAAQHRAAVGGVVARGVKVGVVAAAEGQAHGDRRLVRFFVCWGECAVCVRRQRWSGGSFRTRTRNARSTIAPTAATISTQTIGSTARSKSASSSRSAPSAPPSRRVSVARASSQAVWPIAMNALSSSPAKHSRCLLNTGPEKRPAFWSSCKSTTCSPSATHTRPGLASPREYTP